MIHMVLYNSYSNKDRKSPYARLAFLLLAVCSIFQSSICYADIEASSFDSKKIEAIHEAIAKDRSRDDSTMSTASTEQDSSSLLVRMVKGLVICLALFLAGVYIAKNRGKKPNTITVGRIKFIERLPLTSKNSVILLEVDGERVLVTTGSENSTLVSIGKSQSKHLRFEELCEDDIALSA